MPSNKQNHGKIENILGLQTATGTATAPLRSLAPAVWPEGELEKVVEGAATAKHKK